MKSFIADKNRKLSKLALYHIEDLSFSTFMKALRKKDVKVNGKRVSQDVTLSVGDKVEIYYIESTQTKFEIVYKDQNVLVVDKKKGYTSENVFDEVKSQFSTASFIHRLDRNTCGLMIFALSEDAEKELLCGFKNRTFDKYYPFPEEINRVFADAVCTYHFAPTDKSCENLINSQIPKTHIYKTGNTVIDALLYTVENHDENVDGLNLDKNLKTILLTSHRRENFGEPIKEICNAVLELVEKNKDIQVVYPVHPNPNVQKPVYEILAGKDRIHLIKPLEYAQFCSLMKKAYIIMTDSGGVQEEAPSLGKPVLVLRDTTERPEAVEYGTVKLVGADKNKIITEVQKLLDNEKEYKKMSEAVNPYGDGLASKRIVDVLKGIK